MAKVLGVIPARHDSTRLPGKPLIKLEDKSIVQRVYEQASKTKLLSEVIVATDDQRIFDHVTEFGGQVIMTSIEHKNGTERCAEVAKKMQGFDFIVNIQGDEPFIDPNQIDELVDTLIHYHAEIATQAKLITSAKELFDEKEAKVVFNRDMEVLYMSRNPIPYFNDATEGVWHEKYRYYKHIGIYGFKREVLINVASLSPTELEQAESLEQLRWLDDYKIKLCITSYETLAIDTQKDLLEAEKFLKNQD